jgi:hypothetical protein
MEHTLLSLIFPLQGLRELTNDQLEAASLDDAQLLKALETKNTEKSLIIYGEDCL